MVHTNCHHHHHDHLDSKSGGFPQSDTHLPHPVVKSCPVCINFNFLWWESIPCVNFNSTSFDGSTSHTKIHSISRADISYAYEKVQGCWVVVSSKNLTSAWAHTSRNFSKLSIVQFPFLAMYAHSVRKNNDTRPTPRHIWTIYKTILIRNVRQASRHFLTRYSVTLGSSTILVGLLREKRKRKATHCGSDYRRTLESLTAASDPKWTSS